MRRQQEGQTLLEFVLIAHISLLSLLMLFYAYQWLYARMALRYATFAAARTASVYYRSTVAADRAINRSFSLAYKAALQNVSPEIKTTLSLSEVPTAGSSLTWLKLTAKAQQPLWCSRRPWSTWFKNDQCASYANDTWETVLPIW